jgi:hypothetical protein
MTNILVIHQVGSIGKSTISAVIVRPRLGGKFYSIEDLDTDGERYGEKVALLKMQWVTGLTRHAG